MTPRTITTVVVTSLAALSMLAGFVITALNYSGLPDSVPIHYGIGGQPDRFASKPAIFLLPVIGFASFALLALVGKFPNLAKKPWLSQEQNRKRVELSKSFMPWLNLLICLMFFYIQWATIQTALGITTGLNPAIMICFVGGILLFSLWFTIKAIRSK